MKTRKQSTFKYKIINGYSCIFVPNTDKTVHITCAINSGYIHETKKTCGISHLLEHILVSAWKNCGKSCNSYWDNRGAFINASTDKTCMQYFIKGLHSDLHDMVQYLSTIVTSPIWSTSIINREKKAIMDELLELSTDPKITNTNMFCKLFYTIEGIQHSDDWKLQIENLKKLDVNKLKTIYKELFVPQNMLFVIVGGFSLSSTIQLFNKYLVPSSQSFIKYPACFTYKHLIRYINYSSENTTIMIGFPSKTEMPLLLDPLMDTIHSLLFKEMRTINKLIYDVELTNETNQCGTTIIFKINVQNHNIKKCMQLLFYWLHKYKTSIPESYISASIKRELYKYYTNEKTMMTHYLSYIHTGNYNKIYTQHEIIEIIKKIKVSDFTKLCTNTFNFEHALCVYNGPVDAKITWDQIKID